MKHKIGFTCSSFDLLHAGHILMLEEAKSVCDYLIVGLQVDPSVDRKNKNKPVQSLVERQIQLSAVRYVDQVIVYTTEQELLEIIQAIPMDIRIVGQDYVNSDFTGKEYCQAIGVEIYYNRRRHDYSSSELVNRIKNV